VLIYGEVNYSYAFAKAAIAGDATVDRDAIGL
jgi:hypothetical protein